MEFLRRNETAFCIVRCSEIWIDAFRNNSLYLFRYGYISTPNLEASNRAIVHQQFGCKKFESIHPKTLQFKHSKICRYARCLFAIHILKVWIANLLKKYSTSYNTKKRPINFGVIEDIMGYPTGKMLRRHPLSFRNPYICLSVYLVLRLLCGGGGKEDEGEKYCEAKPPLAFVGVARV